MSLIRDSVVPRVRGLAVHLYTASGILFSLLAARELMLENSDPRQFFLWLLIALLIDATDGPLARRWQVARWGRPFDGGKMDDIVDYVNYTFLPLLMVFKSGWLSDQFYGDFLVGLAMVTSLFGFANEGAKDARGFFLGFPSYWNIVAFYLGFIAHSGLLWVNSVIVLLFSILTLVPLKWAYPNLLPAFWRRLLVGGALVWMLYGLWLLYLYPEVAPIFWVPSLLYPLLYFVLSIYLGAGLPPGKNKAIDR